MLSARIFTRNFSQAPQVVEAGHRLAQVGFPPSSIPVESLRLTGAPLSLLEAAQLRLRQRFVDKYVTWQPRTWHPEPMGAPQSLRPDFADAARARLRTPGRDT